MSARFSLQIIFFSCTIVIFSSCAPATMPSIQPQVNNLVVAERYNYAAQILEDNRLAYGKKDELLYYLDAGMVAHFSRRYFQSIQYFEKAKAIYDKLYTISLSNQVSTWLVNDKLADYRGEDFERVMINFFQAVNYVMIGKLEEALVEARNVDRMLTLINSQYSDDHKNKYRQDGATRLLMGILYEATKTAEGYDNAYISFKKAVEAYESEYSLNSEIKIPRILKEKVIALAKKLRPDDLAQWEEKFSDVIEDELKKDSSSADVYLIYYGGLVPIKHQFSLPIPLPNGFFGKLAFPQYDDRMYTQRSAHFKAISDQNQEASALLEPIQDIGYLAKSSLDDRKQRVIAKAILRSAGKFIVEDITEEAVHKNYGDTAGDVFRYLASLYNIASEEADLRSWQTLPNQIKIAKLHLSPGAYTLYYDDKKVSQVNLKEKETRFFFFRSTDE